MTSGNEPVDTETREQILQRDDYRCQTCGKYSPKRGGPAALEVHHIDRNPTGMREHDPANLTTLCQSCHNWHHQQTDPEELDHDFTDAEQERLIPNDYEILRILANHGPAPTGAITNALSADLTRQAVRERLWVLMGLDRLVDDRETQLIDQDPNSGEWGLPSQIETSARGYVPDAPETLLKRAEDERVRRALHSGCSREDVAAVMGVQPRTTWHKERRAVAYQFPLDKVIKSGGLASVDLSRDLADTIGHTQLDPGTNKGQTGPTTLQDLTGDSDDAVPRACQAQSEGTPTADGMDLTLVALLDDGPEESNQTELIQDLAVLAERGLIEQHPPASPSMTYRVTTEGWELLERRLRRMANWTRHSIQISSEFQH